MTRTRNGQVVERQWKSGRGYALRFLANGRRQYVTLGLERDGWDRARAEEELQNVMADVRRGIWIPPNRTRAARPANGTASDGEGVVGCLPGRSAAPAARPVRYFANDRDGHRGDRTSAEIPTFHEFATDWLARREGEVAPRTVEYERWALTHHLLPHFAHEPLTAIDIAAVDAYRCTKVAESDRRRHAIEAGRPLRSGPNRTGPALRPLSPATVNKTIDVLQSVLALAQEYGHIADNPATGRRRRLKAPKPRPVHLDAAEPIQALLAAAATLDADRRHRMRDRHAIIATLLFAGLRAHELCQLRWRDIDLPGARLHVTRSKTDAGRRTIDLLPVLRAVLAAHRDRSPATGPDDLVFPTESGTQRDKDNLRNRVLEPTIPIADRLLADRGHPPLPRGLTPHKLRHTYASILVASGTDPAAVMHQLGHTDPHFTLRTYTHVIGTAMEAEIASLRLCRQLVHYESHRNVIGSSSFSRDPPALPEGTHSGKQVPHQRPSTDILAAVIRELRLRNYKSYSGDAAAPLRRITVLLGKNSSGKTAVARLPLLLFAGLADRAMRRAAPLPLEVRGLRYGADLTELVHGESAHASFGLGCTVQSPQFGDEPIALSIGIQLRQSLKSGLTAFVTDFAASPRIAQISWDRRTDSDALTYAPNTVLGFDGLLPRASDHATRRQAGDLAVASAQFSKGLVHLTSLRQPLRPLYENRTLEGDWDIEGCDTPYLLDQSAEVNAVVSAWYRDRLETPVSVSKEPSSFRLVTRSHQGSEHNLAFSGQGVQQVLPVVVHLAAMSIGYRSGTLVVEEPELNLHPAAHGALAELILAAASGDNQIIVETHSENLVLRLRYFVAAGLLRPEDINILWFDKSDGSTTISEIAICPDGSVNRWPSGVFAEDLAEARAIAQVAHK